MDQGQIPDREIDLWDRTNERAVINQVPPRVQEAFIVASQKEPELFGIDERDLFTRLRNTRRTPSPTDNRIRLAFWFEYDQAQLQARKFEIKRAFGGVCGEAYFYQSFITNSARLAWLLTPPTDYVIKTQEALDFGLDRLRDILEREPVNAKGQFDVRLAELQAKITWMLEQRVKGAVVTKIEQKTFGVNVHTSDKQVANALMDGSMAELDRRLKDLEREERKLMNLPKPKDIEVQAGEPDGTE